MTSLRVGWLAALLVALLAASGAGARDFHGWKTDHNFSEHVVGGYVGYLNSPDGKLFALFQKSSDGVIDGFVGAEGCEMQLDIEMPSTTPGASWDAARRKPVQQQVSRLLSRIAAACHVPRPADRVFFRGFAEAFADLDFTHPSQP